MRASFQRLDLTGAFWIGALARLPCLLLFFFAFFHSLGEAGFRVDEPFSGVTHVCPCFAILSSV